MLTIVSWPLIKCWRCRFQYVFILLVIAWFVAGNGWTEERLDTSPARSALPAVLSPSAGGELTFETFAQQVLANHPTLQQSRLDMGIASAQRLSKSGAFDPYLSGTSNTQRYNSSSSPGKAQLGSENEVTLTLPTRLGASLLAGGKLAAGDIKTPLSPTGAGGEYYWGVKLPLLRGFLMNEKLAAERQAKIKETMAAIKYRKAQLDVLKAANKAFWGLAGATQSVDVANQLQDLADVRLQQLERLVAAGDEANIVAVEARQEVAKRQGQRAKALRYQQQGSYALGLFLWQSPAGQGHMVATQQAPLLSTLPFLTVPSAPSPPPTEDERSQDIDTALRERPEPQLIGLASMVAEVDRALATNNLLPQLDLTAIHGIETGQDAIGPVFKAGIQLQVPLRYRTPLGQLRTAKLILDQLAIESQQVAQQIRIDVQDAASEWEARYQQYLAAQLEHDTAQTMAEGERTRFKLGDTTLFLVNQRERAEADAAIKLIEAKMGVFEAEQAYKLVLGLV